MLHAKIMYYTLQSSLFNVRRLFSEIYGLLKGVCGTIKKKAGYR